MIPQDQRVTAGRVVVHAKSDKVAQCLGRAHRIRAGVAQQLPGKKLKWCSKSQKFDLDAANALVKPYIRKGWEF